MSVAGDFFRLSVDEIAGALGAGLSAVRETIARPGSVKVLVRPKRILLR